MVGRGTRASECYVLRSYGSWAYFLGVAVTSLGLVVALGLAVLVPAATMRMRRVVRSGRRLRRTVTR
jgi:hypothetical protein